MHEWIDQLKDTSVAPDGALIRQQLSASLQDNFPQVPPRYLYDALGSSLFSAITVLPEYYPSRLEQEILHTQCANIASSVADADTLVDLGTGDGAKACSLLPALQSVRKLKRYVGMDISRDCLRQTASRIAQSFPPLSVAAVATDFSAGLVWPDTLEVGRPVFFYPGSSIGNFSLQEAVRFLQSLRNICQRSRSGKGDLLIGVDLVKSRAQMEAAYDDALGVTACFNRNVLLHLNRLLSADFDLKRFRHRASFNVQASRIEMSLECTASHTVSWQGGTRHFMEGEQLLTEHSYKYTPERFDRLLIEAGFVPRRQWFDASRGFMLCHASSPDE